MTLEKRKTTPQCSRKIPGSILRMVYTGFVFSRPPEKKRVFSAKNAQFSGPKKYVPKIRT